MGISGSFPTVEETEHFHLLAKAGDVTLRYLTLLVKHPQPMAADFKNHTPGGGGRADDLYKGSHASGRSESQTVGVEGEQTFDLPNQKGDSRYVTAKGTTKPRVSMAIQQYGSKQLQWNDPSLYVIGS